MDMMLQLMLLTLTFPQIVQALTTRYYIKVSLGIYIALFKLFHLNIVVIFIYFNIFCFCQKTHSGIPKEY